MHTYIFVSCLATTKFAFFVRWLWSAHFLFSGATMKILLLFIALILILPLIGHRRYDKSDYWDKVLGLLGYFFLLFVLIIVVAILKI